MKTDTEYGLSQKVIQCIQKLGGTFQKEKFLYNAQDKLPKALQAFSFIEWNEKTYFQSKRYSVNNIFFESVEECIFDKEEWKENKWIQENSHVYILGHCTNFMVTINIEDMSDFPIYLLSLKDVQGPIPLSLFLKSCENETQGTYHLNHGDDIFLGIDFDQYFNSKDPILSVKGKKSQESVWFSGKASKLMDFYKENYKEQTVSWIGKKMEKYFKNISYSTLIRFVANVVDDLLESNQKRLNKK